MKSKIVICVLSCLLLLACNQKNESKESHEGYVSQTKLII